MHRIEKYTSRNTICPDEKFAGTSTSSNINQPLDFFKLFLTDELTNEIVRETNNYARKKLEGKLGQVRLGTIIYIYIIAQNNDTDFNIR